MSSKAKMPKLRRNKATGIYYIHWSRGGRSHRKSTYTTDEALAQKIVAKFILEGMHERDDSDDKTISALMAEYERNHVRRKVRSKDTHRYCEANLLAFFGEKRLDEINSSVVNTYVDRRARGLIGKPSKSSTIRRELGVMISAINFAVRERIILSHEVPYIPLPEESAPKERWLTKEEANSLYDACPVNDPETGKMTRVFLFAKIAINTAARRGAIEELKWDQVDLENKVIHFNPKGRRQTKKRRASVPINDDLLFVLERAWDERENGAEHVLGAPKDIYKEFKDAVARAGLVGVTPHTLRHTYGTWAAQRGVPLWKIAGVMGDTIETASRNYLHHCPDELRDAV